MPGLGGLRRAGGSEELVATEGAVADDPNGTRQSKLNPLSCSISDPVDEDGEDDGSVLLVPGARCCRCWSCC